MLSWNIQWGCGHDGRANLGRIATVIRSLGPIDVICLQEVAVNHPGLQGSSGEDQVAALTAEFPDHAPQFGIASDLAGEAGARRLFGNLMLSRLPVLQVFRHSLPQRAERTAATYLGMPRMALEAVINAGSQSIRVITTHLEYYSAAQRASQVGHLRTLHDEAFSHTRARAPGDELDPPFRSPSRPVASVYCGDFNCEPGSEAHDQMTKPFESGATRLFDAWSLAHPDTPHVSTVGLHGFDWPDHPYCCDYFFVSDDLRHRVRDVKVEQTTDASDHQPIVLELDLPG